MLRASARCRATCFALALLLALPSLASAGSATPDAAVRPRDVLRLAGPTAVVSFPLLHMVDSGALKPWADRLEFRFWQGPDQLRTLLLDNQIDVSAAPSNLPALLANRGQPVRLLNVSVWGLLWLVSRDPAVRDFSDLAGRELVTPFQRDLPALLLHALLEAKGLDPARDVRLRPARDSLSGAALLLAGQADQMIIAEPSTSLLLWRQAHTPGKYAPLRRVQSLETAWREAFPDQPELPQAGLMAWGEAARDAGLGAAIERAYAESARWCSSQVDACAALVHRYQPQFPHEALAESIRVTRLDSVPAHAARAQLEALYALLARGNPQAIGGKLPAAEFYGQ
ncbi:hypothetical protein [Dokdonella sp.]|uniref:hypothetical protein n=1 Tax=Dokdonella sp. TaxID=2291710 RepID=UPI0031CAE5A6|nr:hypothetical protein [Dokdonella sp.]